jgi:hypothetical protein
MYLLAVTIARHNNWVHAFRIIRFSSGISSHEKKIIVLEHMPTLVFAQSMKDSIVFMWNLSPWNIHGFTEM